MTKPNQKDEYKVTLRLVDPDIPPDAPLEERMDLEATKRAHKALRDAGKTPHFMVNALEAIGLHAPTPQDIKWVEQVRASGCSVCGNCRHFNYQAGQDGLERGGAQSLMERLGSKVATLGDWRRYGICEAKEDMLTAFEAPSYDCPHFQDRKKAGFGRILSGVWKRINEI